MRLVCDRNDRKKAERTVRVRTRREAVAQNNEDGRTTAQASQAVATPERGPERNVRPEDKRAAGVIAQRTLLPPPGR